MAKEEKCKLHLVNLANIVNSGLSMVPYFMKDALGWPMMADMIEVTKGDEYI